MRRTADIAHTVLCLGLNKLIRKIPRRCRRLFIAALIINELCGILRIYAGYEAGLLSWLF